MKLDNVSVWNDTGDGLFESICLVLCIWPGQSEESQRMSVMIVDNPNEISTQYLSNRVWLYSDLVEI
jgi:hypothetical protein